MRPLRDERPRRGASSASVMVGTLVLAVGVAGLWWATGESDRAPVDADRVVTVERQDLINAVNSNGRVEPLARVAVMSRAGGILKEILVEEGDVVAPGLVLAELDREQLEANLAQGEADLAAAKARLASTRARLSEARVRLDDPELEFREHEFRRLDELYQSGDVSRRDRDDADLAWQVVRFRIEQVAASIPVLEAAEQEAVANLAAAEAAVERTRTSLREATIRSPIHGIVLTRDKEVGDGVSSILTAGGNATQILTLGDLSEMYVKARVDEVDLGRIFVGMPAIVTVDAHRGRVLEGSVARIAPAGSVDNNGIVTFEVRVTVADPDGLLRPDMTADAKLVLGRQQGALALPHRALVRQPGGRWTASKVVGSGPDARLVPADVTIGLSDGLMTEITSGLAEGDRVLMPLAPASRGFP